MGTTAMTNKQLERQRKAGRQGGKACLAKYGREHFAAIGRKGGSQSKSIVYIELKKQEGVGDRSPAKMLEALSNRSNLKEGGLVITRKTRIIGMEARINSERSGVEPDRQPKERKGIKEI